MNFLFGCRGKRMYMYDIKHRCRKYERANDDFSVLRLQFMCNRWSGKKYDVNKSEHQYISKRKKVHANSKQNHLMQYGELLHSRNFSNILLLFKIVWY